MATADRGTSSEYLGDDVSETVQPRVAFAIGAPIRWFDGGSSQGDLGA